MEVFEPDNLLLDSDVTGYTQIREVSPIVSDWPFFKYDSFQTKTKACPVRWYQVSTIVDPIQVPFGVLDENDVCESEVSADPNVCKQESGIVYTNTHIMQVTDGENPTTYNFRIKLLAHGGNELWFPTDSSIFYSL